MQHLNSREQMIQAEALYSFVAEITISPTTLTASSKHESGVWACKVRDFLVDRGNQADPYPRPQGTYENAYAQDSTFYKFGNETGQDNTVAAENNSQPCLFEEDEASTTSTLVFESMAQDLLDTSLKSTASKLKPLPSAREALAVLSQHMNDDPGFAWAWHCNLAMMVKDGGASYKDANIAAAQFMKQAFEVDVTDHPTYVKHME